MIPRFQRALARILVTALASAGAVVGVGDVAALQSPNVVQRSSSIAPATLQGFSAGNLIDDGVFFNSATMTEAEIQAFLEQKVPRCQAGYTCLRDWRDTSRSTAADAMCGAYSGESNERASRIIYKVAQACGINPQVLLVTLQKEQGLVTHTWPSEWRYTIAMGQGCPDTAACDERYHGFFNQVYGAAWQFKRYANPPGTSTYFTWYAPGKTWNVQYNPDRTCGSSPVLIENQATANLYYYTPYQPNAAALAAGYGEGDRCSTYGNRNFYNYFTDWFGTVRGSGIVLARTAGDPAVYFLSDGKKWHIADSGDHASLTSAFGRTYVVSDAFLSTFTSAGLASAILRNSGTGEIAYFQEGSRHRFATCELVWRWNGDCNALPSISSKLFDRVAAGTEMTAFYRDRASGRWGRIEADRSMTPMWDEAAARAANGSPGSSLYAAYANPSLIAIRPKAALLFAPAQLVKSTASDRVFLTVGTDALFAVPTWSAVAEYRSAATLAVVKPEELSRYREAGTVQPTLRCGSTVYFPVRGVLRPLVDPARVGLPAMDGGQVTCSQFPVGTAIQGTPLIKKASAEAVAAVEGGTRRVVSNWASLVRHQSGTPIEVLTVLDSTFDSLARGVPVADGDIVKGAGPTLSLVSGTRSHPVPSFVWAADAGLRMTYSLLDDADLGKLQSGPALGQWLTCNGQTWFAGGGALRAVTSGAASGFSPAPLSAAACERFARDAQALDVVLVKARSDDAVYIAQAGVFRHVTSWSRVVSLAGPDPKIIVLSSETLATLPQGAPLS